MALRGLFANRSSSLNTLSLSCSAKFAAVSPPIQATIWNTIWRARKNGPRSFCPSLKIGNRKICAIPLKKLSIFCEKKQKTKFPIPCCTAGVGNFVINMEGGNSRPGLLQKTANWRSPAGSREGVCKKENKLGKTNLYKQNSTPAQMCQDI